MKSYVLFLAAFISFSFCFSQNSSGKTYYLVHVALIDVISGGTLPDMTIGISNSLIVAVGSSVKFEVPRNAKVIDCTGKFILPGLWDMHVHLGNATRSALPLFVANGVTGVRDMGTKRFDSIQQWSPFGEKTKYFEPSTKDFMINYRVVNLETLVQQLKTEGVNITDTIETFDYGKFVHILDIEGNKIELWEPNDQVYEKLGEQMGSKTTK